jgi:secretion/DNA translocation related TadE-like protein
MGRRAVRQHSAPRVGRPRLGTAARRRAGGGTAAYAAVPTAPEAVRTAYPSVRAAPETLAAGSRRPADRRPADRRPADRRPADRGSATVLLVAVIAAVLVVATAGVQLGAAMVTRHRATAAADLAALGAAVDAVYGETRACERATWVVERMGGALVSCRLDGWDALVEVTARPPEPLDRFGAATARARAGPAEG